MEQDKEYIPEWKQPHINNNQMEFKSKETHYTSIKYLSFTIDNAQHCIKKKRICEVLLYPDGMLKDIYSLELRTKKGETFCQIDGSKKKLQPVYQSILDQLNQ